MENINNILDKIIKLCDPASIFLYGSRARTDFLKKAIMKLACLFQKTDILKSIYSKTSHT